MSRKTEHGLFIASGVVAIIALLLLFLGPETLLGDEATTEYVLKTASYPLVLVFLVLAWRKIDRKLNNKKPEE